MLLAERCSSTERCFLVESDRGGEKGFFSERALGVLCKHTLREAPFISYANLECTWLAADSRVPPVLWLSEPLISVSKCQGPVFAFLVHWVNVLHIAFLFSYIFRLTETWIWLLVNVLLSFYHLLLFGCLLPFRHTTTQTGCLCFRWNKAI